MEIWAHTMVKNDARWLWYSISSVINHIDRLLLWDTGSTDGSIEIEKDLVRQYPEKIVYRQRKQNTSEDFAIVRQEMLDETRSDWFLMLDGDEIWWDESIKKVIAQLRQARPRQESKIESVVVPTVNLVGDIFHYQEKSAGMYNFGKLKGHYNLRVIKRNIPGLHSQGIHGLWGWADNENKMVQDRNTFEFVNAPYLHATFLPRATSQTDDSYVVKRQKKYKHETGIEFPLDFYYPEAFFTDKPEFVLGPWSIRSTGYRLRASIETPIKLIKRQLIPSRVGY